MRIIGVDPGLECTGIGVIDVSGDRCLHLFHGTVRTKASEGTLARLQVIRAGVAELCARWEAEAAAIEASFVGTNAKSALALGQARAAAMLGLGDGGLAVAEYSPTVVKQSVAGYGRGDKAQVAEMVRVQLGLRARPAPSDAADALAIAMTHWAHTRSGLAGRL